MGSLGPWRRAGHGARAPATRPHGPQRRSPEPPPMLEVLGLTKRFGGLAAVKDVSTRFEPGKITAVIGPNGAGKTTFFNLCAGRHHPTSGKILLDGVELSRLRPDQVAALGIARTFQTTNLFE